MLTDMKLKLMILPLLVILLSTFLFSQSPCASTSEIIVGTSTNYAPFEFKKNGSIKGFDIDLMEAIERRKRIDIQWVDMEFASLIPALRAGKIDCIAAAMSKTHQRDQVLNFSVPYWNPNPVVMVRNTSSIDQKSELQKVKAVGTCKGGPADKWVREQLLKKGPITNNQINYYSSTKELVKRMFSSEIEAIVVSKSVAEIISRNQPLKIAKEGSLTKKGSGRMAFAAGKENDKLLQKINKGLQEVIDKGDYKELVQKWFKVPLGIRCSLEEKTCYELPPESKKNTNKLKIEVNSESGEDIVASKVYLGGTFKGTTDKNGEYIISGLSMGTYRIKVDKEDYLSNSVKVHLSSGESEKIFLELDKQNQQPKPSFTYSPKEPTTDQQVTFDALSSTDPDGTIESYGWYLNGDGTTDKSGSKVNYIYDSKGTYRVKLTVTDDNGASSSVTKQIEVSEPRQEAKVDEKHGLVVGITKYEYNGLNNLSFPAKDAKAFYDLLINQGGFKKKNVTLLTNKEATTYRLDTELSKLVTKTNKDDLVVIYYSGHGAQGKDYDGDEKKDERDEYYITYNTDPTNSKTLYNTAYRDDQFANRVKSISTNQIAIFLDSCYSGGATKSVKGYTLPGQKAAPENNVFSDFDKLEGKVLFAASQENQSSYEPNTDKMKEKLGHGVFTYYLLKGLKGKADKDGNGTITVEELKGYGSPSVEEFTEEHFSSPQVPLVKGAISAPIIQEKQRTTGKVKYVKGEGKNKAHKGEYVVINLGSEDGVKVYDRFKVVYATKGVIIEKLHTEIKITDVVGPHLAVGKVTESGLTVEKGFKVRKVENE